MTISLNGERIDARGARSISELVSELALAPQTVLVEHNGEALHRHEWEERLLGENDRIELLHVVAGG